MVCKYIFGSPSHPIGKSHHIELLEGSGQLTGLISVGPVPEEHQVISEHGALSIL